MKIIPELTETITPEEIVKSICPLDIRGHRDALRWMMDGYFLKCADGFGDPEASWCAYQAVDHLLENIQEYYRQIDSRKQAVGIN